MALLIRAFPGVAAAWATTGRRALLAALAALFVTAATAGHHEFGNNYVLLAQAFVHRQIPIAWPGDWVDALPYHGRYYVIEGPLPAVLLLPWVALFGSADQIVLTILMCAVAVGLGWVTCERVGASPQTAAWLCAFLFAGTQLGGARGWAATSGSLRSHNGRLHVRSARRLAGRGAVGLSRWRLCAATFARFPLALALPIFAWLVAFQRRRPTAGAPAGFGRSASLPQRSGSRTTKRDGLVVRYRLHGVVPPGSRRAPVRFAVPLRYFPHQLWSFFCARPAVVPTLAYMIPTYSGLAMTWTSPAFVLALFARRPAALVIGLWIATLLVAGPSFIYYVNGYAQFGMRHALDFEPFLVVLMALAYPSDVPRWGRALIVWSVLVGIWGVWLTVLLGHDH